MYATKLRKVGGSVMVALPTPLLNILRLRVGEQVGLSLEGDRLLLMPQRQPHYTMAELLAATDYSGRRAAEEQEWLETPPQGREIL